MCMAFCSFLKGKRLRARRGRTRPNAFSFGSALAVLLTLSGCGSLTSMKPEPSIKSTGVVDLQGRAVDPFQMRDAGAIVLLFVRTDCPVSNRYAPEIERMRAKYAAQGVVFWLVYPDEDTTT